MHEYVLSEKELRDITQGNEISYCEADIKQNLTPELDNFEAIVADLQFGEPTLSSGV